MFDSFKKTEIGKRFLSLTLCVVCGLTLFQPAHAEEMDTVVLRAENSTIILDIPTLIDLVKNQSLDLSISNSRIKQAKYSYYASFAELFPSLREYMLLERYTGSDIFIGQQPVSVNRTTFRPRIAADFNIQTGGKPIFQARVAKAKLNETKDDFERQFQKSLLDTFTEYLTWLKNIATIHQAEQNLKEATSRVQFNEARYKNGFGTLLDVQQAKTYQATKKSELLKAQNEVQVSASKLSALLNIPLLDTLVPENPELSVYRYWDSSMSLPELLKLAEKHRPDIQILNHTIQEAKASLAVAKSEFFPTITLSGYFGNVGPPDNLRRTFQRGVSLNTDILRNLDIGLINNVRLNREKVREALLNKEKQLNYIEQSIAQTYYDKKLYEEQMQVAQEKLETAQSAYKIATSRAEKGFGINLEVAQALSNLSDARMEYVTAVMNNNVALLRLLFSTGQLTPENLVKATSGEMMLGFN